MVGNEEDFTACLGFTVPETGPELDALEAGNFRLMIADVVAEYDQLSVVATTLRTVRSATINDWGAVAWSAETGFVEPSIGASSRSSIVSAAATASPRG